MKVLFATLPQPNNRFVPDLMAGIEKYAQVIHDHKEFWNCSNHFDVIHIHEPEYLSYEIEACMYNTDPIPQELWNRLIACLEHWKKNSVIVHTRHVQEPHVRADDEFRKLYKTVFSYCNGIAHFANFSISQFKAFYPDLGNIRHKVIPHHNYASLSNSVSREEARRRMNIHTDATVMLVFGFIKEHEKPLIREAFKAIPGRNKVLLAPGWKIQRRKIGYIRLREWVFKLECRLAAKNKNRRINLGFVDDKDAQYYCNAADFLLTPRIHELNSGNITFGFTFGLVVVGKSDADIGEVLSETGNPVFNPMDKVSVKNSVLKATELSNKGQGKINQELALKEWGIEKIAGHYIELYECRNNKDY